MSNTEKHTTPLRHSYVTGFAETCLIMDAFTWEREGFEPRFHDPEALRSSNFTGVTINGGRSGGYKFNFAGGAFMGG